MRGSGLEARAPIRARAALLGALRDCYPDPRPVPHAAFQVHAAAHGADRMSDDGKAQSSPALRPGARPLDLIEALEYTLLLLLGNATAVVDYLEDRFLWTDF